MAVPYKLIDQELHSSTSNIEAALAGIASGVIKIPEGWKEVKPGAATAIEYKDKTKMDKQIGKLGKEINISDISTSEKAQVGVISKPAVKTLFDTFYDFPKRISEMLRLRAEDIDTKKGTVRFFVSKLRHETQFKDELGEVILDKQGKPITGEYQELPLGKISPKVFQELVKLAKGKKPKDYIFTTKDGTLLSPISVRGMLDYFVGKAKVEPVSIRGGKKMTPHHFRHSFVRDAITIKRESKGEKDYIELAKEIALFHKPEKTAFRHYKEGQERTI